MPASLRRSLAASLLVAGAACASAPSAWAAPTPWQKAQQGLAAARKGDCVTAVPLLEDAELANHSPTTAVALSDCYVATGELIKAADLYRAVADEPRQRRWSQKDVRAQAEAATKADELKARIPTLRFIFAEDYDELSISIDGQEKELEDLTRPLRMAPDQTITIEIEAKKRKPFSKKLVLAEGQRETLHVTLEKDGPPPPPPEPPRPGKWVGARFRGMVIPRWMMQWFGDGGRTMMAPGGGVTLTKPLKDADLVFGLGYSSFRLGATPFKPKDAPDTEYEIIESDLQSLQLTMDLLWSVPLDKEGDVNFRIGGSLGVGFAFGNLYRTQAYAPRGVTDPYQLRKCRGPNDPEGTFRYCNQLDKDKDHYNGYAEPSWFDGGSRPSIYPWLVLPQMGLSWNVSHRFALDAELGLSLSGILTGVGWRVGF